MGLEGRHRAPRQGLLCQLARGKTMFLAPRMIPYFHAVWGVRRVERSDDSAEAHKRFFACFAGNGK